MAMRPPDATQIAMENRERLGSLESKVDVHHERIGVLEKSFHAMSSLPTQMAAMGQKVEGMEKSMIREMDGLREQQKAHKVETSETLERGFASIREQEKQHKESLSSKFDNVIALQQTRQSAWMKTLQTIGQILLGAALIAEAVKALVHS
jgi:hypothetical protein